MRITEVSLKNFRCFKDVTIPIDDITIFIGENNCGKTALLDTIKSTLSQKAGGKIPVFSEYDFFMDSESSSPNDSDGIDVNIKFEEQAVNEWPAEIVQSIDEIIFSDLNTGIKSINLHLTCNYNATSKEFEQSVRFDDENGKPIGGRAIKKNNFFDFLRFTPVFFLPATRDAFVEFSSKSQFWGKLLKSIDLPEELISDIRSQIESLNSDLLSSEPKLTDILETIREANSILPTTKTGDVNIRALPVKPWDLLSRSEIVYRKGVDDPWLPIHKYGQGIQSLSVLFLFKAFINNLLSSIYEHDSSPILTLEEPETHLHPQAARNVFNYIDSFTGQKLITSHSPYFLQNVPLRKIRYR